MLMLSALCERIRVSETTEQLQAVLMETANQLSISRAASLRSSGYKASDKAHQSNHLATNNESCSLTEQTCRDGTQSVDHLRTLCEGLKLRSVLTADSNSETTYSDADDTLWLGTLELLVRTLHQRIGELSRPVNIVTLTEKECRCLQLYANGLTKKSIARELNIEECTVKFHHKNICRKFGVQNLPPALAIAVKHGLIAV